MFMLVRLYITNTHSSMANAIITSEMGFNESPMPAKEPDVTEPATLNSPSPAKASTVAPATDTTVMARCFL